MWLKFNEWLLKKSWFLFKVHWGLPRRHSVILQGKYTHTHTHTEKSLSRVRLFVTPWIVAHQAPREGLGASGEGDDRGWDGWMASLTRWTWVSVNSGSWWWTGRPGVLWFMGLQRVGHNWATDLIWSDLRLLGPWDFPGMNTGVGCRFLLQQGKYSLPHF